MTVWIGYLQWTRANGFGVSQDPVLRSMEQNFQRQDSILDLTDPENPKEPEWPAAEFIVGNPPFLGNKRLRTELGTAYCDRLWALYGDRLPAMSDLCCYWFEKARAQIEAGRCQRAGLLATTGIKQVGARRVLERVAAATDIFFAVSDRDWVLDGASIRISMVGFGHPLPGERPVLDGTTVTKIHPDLSAGLDLTAAARLDANLALCFMGTTKVGAFDIPETLAVEFLRAPNPNGRPNSDVVRPFRNGSDLVRAPSHRWIVDFGVGTTMENAAGYESPFEYLNQAVRPEREKNARKARAEKWWLLGETLPAFRKTVAHSPRYLATPRVAKHRVFVWLDTAVLPDSKVIAMALDDDAGFGVLHSRVHAAWTLATCGWHGKGNDVTYNPTTCFETFPFSEPTAEQAATIGAAAHELNQLQTS